MDVETGFGAMYELSDVLDEQACPASVDPRRARDLHLRALTVRITHGLRTGYADSLDALAALAVVAGNSADAIRLVSASDIARQESGYLRPPVDVPDLEASPCLGAHRTHRRGVPGAVAGWAGRDIDALLAGLTRGRGPRDRPQSGWDSLTPTEIEVATLVRDGSSNPQIASRLYMSRSTVKTHLAHVYAKVGVANRAALAALASDQLVSRALDSLSN